MEGRTRPKTDPTYMTETLEVDKNLLSKLQMSKYSQTAGKQLRT